MIIIESISDFFEFLRVFTSEKENYMYRGVRLKSYKLIPSVGRLRKKDGSHLEIDDEKLILKLFKKKAYPFIKEYKEDPIELLSIAQHHGLPTRLLDWSYNPLIAAFFAVENEIKENYLSEDERFSCIYAAQYVYIDIEEELHPFEISEIKRFVPKHWDSRIVTQNGLFTIHPNPREEWQPESLIKILISQNVRKKIKRVLYKMGINKGIVNPDLDGVSAHIKWLRSNIH